MPELTFEEVQKAVLAAVPEIKDRYDKSAEWQAKVGGSPTQYEVIESMLRPLLTEQLDLDRDSAFLKRVFDFLEEMGRSPDIDVVNLLQIGIFETLVAEPDRLAIAWKYMGEETKEAASDMARR